MKKVVYECNNCGRTIVGRPIKFVPYYCDEKTEEFGEVVNEDITDMHFCEKCIRDIFKNFGVSVKKTCKKSSGQTVRKLTD